MGGGDQERNSGDAGGDSMRRVCWHDEQKARYPNCQQNFHEYAHHAVPLAEGSEKRADLKLD